MSREDIATMPVSTLRRTPAGFTEQLIEPLSRLRGEVDRLFDDFPFRLPALRFATAATMPALEMTETRKGYKITAELPGIDPDAVEVGIENGLLRIAGEKREEHEESETRYRLSERSYGAFERLLRLPDGIDAKGIRARCRNGVLTLTIPKDEKAAKNARRVKVEQA